MAAQGFKDLDALYQELMAIGMQAMTGGMGKEEVEDYFKEVRRRYNVMQSMQNKLVTERGRDSQQRP